MEGAPEPKPWSARNIKLVSRGPLRPVIASLVPRAISGRDARRLYSIDHGPDEVLRRIDFVATVVAASARGEDDPAELGRHAADIIAGGYAPVRLASAVMYHLAWRVCASRETPRDRRSIAALAMVIRERLGTWYEFDFSVYFSAPLVLVAAATALLDDAPQFAGVVACGPAAARRATMGGLPRLWARARREWGLCNPGASMYSDHKIEPDTLEFRSRAEFIRRRRRALESNATACALWRAAATAGAAALGRRADVTRLAAGLRFCAGSSPDPAFEDRGPRRRMSDPLAAGRPADPLAADPLAAEQTTGPLAAEQAAGPLAAEQTAGPLAAEQAAGPLAAEQTAGPLAAEQTAGPLAAEQTAGPLAAEQAAGPLAAEQTAGPLAAAGAALAGYATLSTLMARYEDAEAGTGPAPLPLDAFEVLLWEAQKHQHDIGRWAVIRCPEVIRDRSAAAALMYCETVADLTRVARALASHPEAVEAARSSTNRCISRKARFFSVPLVAACLLSAALLCRAPPETRRAMLNYAGGVAADYTFDFGEDVWQYYAGSLSSAPHSMVSVTVSGARYSRRSMVRESRWCDLSELTGCAAQTARKMGAWLQRGVDHLTSRGPTRVLRRGADEFTRRRLATLRSNAAALARWRAAAIAGAVILRRAGAARLAAGLDF